MSSAVQAIVVAELPQRLFRLRTPEGEEIVAGASPEAQRLGLRLQPGQSVRVRRARLDPGRGVILGPGE
jgi:translation initiation factor IF-1